MGKARRIESGVGRFFMWVGIWLLASLVWCIPVGIFGASNLVWGEPNQYGRVDIPGAGVVHLPSGSVDGTVAMIIPGRGNATPDLLLPSDLSMTVVAVNGSGAATVTRDLGSSANASDSRADTKRHVWKIDVPHAGDYRVTTRGDFTGLGVDVAVWFGHGAPLPGTAVPPIGLALGAITVLVLWLLGRRRRGRRPQRGGDEPSAFGTPLDEHVFTPHEAPRHGDGDLGELDGLERLAKLHREGALTDDEFSAEKAKLLDGG